MPSQEEMAWKSCGALLLDRLVAATGWARRIETGTALLAPRKAEATRRDKKKTGQL